jgi:hypothetical protein
VCRSVDGACDLAETCDGSSKDCPEDGFQLGTVCRSSAGVCDVAETCVGDPDCPLDAFLPASTVCRSAAGVCDVAELCTGSAAACPANVRLSSGTICRSSAGVCDPAEACTGGNNCPVDRKESLSTVCRASAGPCDIADNCSGGNDCEDKKEKSGTVCRSSVGVCDVADTCDGTSSACPQAVAPSGGICRSTNGACDVAEACDGVNPVCPADQFKSSGTVCRPSRESPCDLAESCTGASAACPPDLFAPNTTKCFAQDPNNPCDDDIFCHDGSCPLPTVDTGRLCRDVPAQRAGYCDIAEYCVPGPNGVGVCPPDEMKPQGTLCMRTPNDYCKEDAFCNGVDKACVPNLATPEADGTACLDLQTHSKPGVCTNGSCTLFGARCTVGANPSGCGIGQRCINCAAEGAAPEGYCASDEAPCCSAGAFNDPHFWCGETTYSNGQSTVSLCCDWQCFKRDDDQHCSSCDNNCLGETVGPEGANACFFQPFGGKCNSDTGRAICTGPSVYYPNQICHADGSIWSWYECDTDADCPTDSICGSAAHDDGCQTNRATYGQCVLPYANDPCFPSIPCQSDNKCPGWPDWSCQEVQVTDPNTVITTNQSFCKAGRRCVSDSDCLAGSFPSDFCLKSAPGLPELTTGICSLRSEEEGTFVNLTIPGVGPGYGCTSNADCPSGETCKLGCGGSTTYANLCNEENLCSQ